MNIETIVVGAFQVNCLVIWGEPRKAIIVDPGSEPDRILDFLEARDLSVAAYMLTHAHMDHVVGFDDLRRFSIGDGTTINIHATEACLNDIKRMFSFAFDGTNAYPGYVKPESYLIDGAFTLGETEVVPLPVIVGSGTMLGSLEAAVKLTVCPASSAPPPGPTPVMTTE